MERSMASSVTPSQLANDPANDPAEIYDSPVKVAVPLPAAYPKRPTRLLRRTGTSFLSSSSSDVDSSYHPSVFSRVASFNSSDPGSRPITPPTPFAIPRTPPKHQLAARDVQINRSSSQSSVSANDEPVADRTSPPFNQSQPVVSDLTVSRPVRIWYGGIKAPDPECSRDDEEEQDRNVSQVAPSPIESEDIGGVPAQHDSTHAMQCRTTQETKQNTFFSTQLPVKAREVDVDGKLREQGRKKIFRHKITFQASQISLNGFLIFFTWYFSKYWFALIPLISAAVTVNAIMVFSLIVRRSWKAVAGEVIVVPESPESLVMIVPCYNETKEELTGSLDSLVRQQKIEGHKRAIVVICDGRVRGPGMEKSTADYLLDDILVVRKTRKHISGAYTALDKQAMDVVFQSGEYKGIPYFCIIKQQNQGKRDGLVLVRSFLYNYNRRAESPATIMTNEFFNDMAAFLQEAGIGHVDDLVGMDADTIFADDCVHELIQSSRFPGTMGVAGYVAVDFKDHNWSLWRLYQNTEYTITQCLRRLHQGRVTHKVSCLPGAVQLLKICEETCGDLVLIEKFGRFPSVTDGLLKQIQFSASEDRNHVCHMLTQRSASKTRQALNAMAYTDVPVTWSVYLSQRRRWSLGATGNDWLLIWGPGVQWFERFLSVVSAMTWFLTPFVFAAYGSFIYALIMHPSVLLLCFMTIVLIPIAYYLLIPIWRGQCARDRLQFYAGLAIYIFAGPFIRMIVLCYSVWNIDQLGWGKTRKIISEDPIASKENDVEHKCSSQSISNGHLELSEPRDARKEEKALSDRV